MNKVKDISEYLLENGFDVRVPTVGQSMFPLIRTGDRITITPQRDFVIGDLVAFTRGDNIVCHKLVKIFERDGIRHYQTRGVSHFGLDEPLTLDRVLGKVARIERRDISFMRKIMLVFYPLLNFGRLNAAAISVLTRIRNIFSSQY